MDVDNTKVDDEEEEKKEKLDKGFNLWHLIKQENKKWGLSHAGNDIEMDKEASQFK